MKTPIKTLLDEVDFIISELNSLQLCSSMGHVVPDFYAQKYMFGMKKSQHEYK